LPQPWRLPERGLALYHGPGETARLSHYFLPRLLRAGKNVLMLDGANSADPRLLERLARERGVEFGEFSRHIRIARAFTCFQLTELVARVPRLVAGFPAQVLIVTALPDLYFDEDIRDGDARAAFARALGDLGRWAEGARFIGAESTGPQKYKKVDEALSAVAAIRQPTDSPQFTGFEAASPSADGSPLQSACTLAVAIFSSAAEFSPSPARRHFFAQVAAAAAEVWRFSPSADGLKLLSERGARTCPSPPASLGRQGASLVGEGVRQPTDG